jgi:Tol biopolymer transport system component
VIFDQQDLHRSVGLYSDLFVVGRATGQVRRLTWGARLLDPDLSPDGTSIAAVRAGGDRRELVIVPLLNDGAAVDLGALRRVGSAADTHFSAPRWSPDGMSIVAERSVIGRKSEVVVVDARTGAVQQVFALAGSRVVTPTWRPDGGAVLAAADVDGGPFNLFEFEWRSPGVPTGSAPTTVRQLTRSASGAFWPDISPDGQTVVYVGYTTEGFDVFTSSGDDRRLCALGAPIQSAADAPAHVVASADRDWRQSRARWCRDGSAGRAGLPYLRGLGDLGGQHAARREQSAGGPA